MKQTKKAQVAKVYSEPFIIRENQDLYFPPINQRTFAISIPRRHQRFKKNGQLRNQLRGVNLPVVSQAIDLSLTGANLVFGQYDKDENVFTVCPPESAKHHIVVVPHDVLRHINHDSMKKLQKHALRYTINEGLKDRSYFILEFGKRLADNQTVADIGYRRQIAIDEYRKLLDGQPLTSPSETLLGNYA